VEAYDAVHPPSAPTIRAVAAATPRVLEVEAGLVSGFRQGRSERRAARPVRLDAGIWILAGLESAHQFPVRGSARTVDR
jgi:hypothetical protein